MQRKKNHRPSHFFSFYSFIPILFRNFASAFCKECKDILLNSLSFTTTRKSNTHYRSCSV